jgi:hypothetical protein
MDTDFLTQMAYDCIMLAEKATDVLMSELGAACSRYSNENEYLKGILADVKEIEEDPEEYLDSWNLLEQMDINVFKQRIHALREFIEKTITTPVNERGERELCWPHTPA